MCMKSRHHVATFAALAIAAATPAIAQQGPMPVDVARPISERIVDWDEFTGRFQAVDRVELRSRVSGYLDEIRFEDGQIVEKGDVLFVVDPRPFEATYARVDAELRAAQAELALTEAELERGEQLVTNRTVARSTLDARIAAKLRAEAQVAIAEATLSEAALNLEFTQVKAPFSGRISDSRADVGNLVISSETVLATIIVTDPIHLVFTASEADFLKYSRLSAAGTRPSSRNSANRVQAKLIDERDWLHTGEMNFVDSELDAGTGTIRGRAIFENSDDLLTPGLFARLRLVGSGEYDALLLPDEAILADQSRRIVMVVDGEGKVEARVIEPGPLYRGFRVVKSGLESDDRVIVSGVQRARPGGEVIPTEVELSFPE
ncbi:MAG: efflux RND transporter periplasmic adaptor subunit [Pseudomonadota bacterium]